MLTRKMETLAISAAYQRILTDTACFHDWYLKDMYVANTGKEILEVSKNGYTTIQIEMCTSNNDIGYLLLFINVRAFHVKMETSTDVSKFSFTSFGRCDKYNIEQNGKEQKHTLSFEGDSCISITCDKVKYKKIYNTHFTYKDIK